VWLFVLPDQWQRRGLASVRNPLFIQDGLDFCDADELDSKACALRVEGSLKFGDDSDQTRMFTSEAFELGARR
jgi:hypothetical protein